MPRKVKPPQVYKCKNNSDPIINDVIWSAGECSWKTCKVTGKVGRGYAFGCTIEWETADGTKGTTKIDSSFTPEGIKDTDYRCSIMERSCMLLTGDLIIEPAQ
jgi:hypothetical protein